MLSDPKLQATYAIMKNPFPWRSAHWAERDQEIRRFAQLATWSELAVTKEEYQLYANGVKPKGERTMDKLTVITTTIAGTFKVQIDDPNKTFAVYLVHPDASSISARASCLLEAELADLKALGYTPS